LQSILFLYPVLKQNPGEIQLDVQEYHTVDRRQDQELKVRTVLKVSEGEDHIMMVVRAVRKVDLDV